MRSSQTCTKTLIASLLLALLSGACIPTEAPPPERSEPPPPAESWFGVYFSDPGGPDAESLRGGPDAALAEAIAAARLSVDAALYDLNLWSIRDALLAAHRRGVAVRLVAESDNLERPEFGELIDAGIPLVGDDRQGLMHDKFVVIDRYEVWTGSMNLTLNGAYRNDNNLLRLRSSRLAEDYLAEFEEMFTAGQFGPGSPANTPYPLLSVDGSQVEVYFSPDDGALAHILALVAGAQESVYFMAYAFTSDDLALALLAADAVGVQVAGVVEASQSNASGAEYARLAEAGLDIHLDGNSGALHHKVVIIDGRTVIAGSYNFTASAEERNDENVIVIHDAEVALLFLQEFQRVLARAENAASRPSGLLKRPGG